MFVTPLEPNSPNLSEDLKWHSTRATTVDNRLAAKDYIVDRMSSTSRSTAPHSRSVHLSLPIRLILYEKRVWREPMTQYWIMAQLTKAIVEAAIEGLQARKQHIDSQLAELRAMLSNGNAGRPEATAGPESLAPVRRKRGGISAE